MLALVFLSVSLAGPADEPDFTKWTAELGNANYAVREKAAQRLWEAGPSAERFVRESLNSPDAEVVRRARQLVDKYDWGIYADTPPAIAGLISKYRGGDDDVKQHAMRDLVKAGRPAFRAIAKIASRTTRPHERALIGEAMADAVRDELPKQIRANDLASAEELLATCLAAAESPSVLDHYLAVVIFANRLEAVRPMWQERMKTGQRGAVSVAFALARAAGDFSAARSIAEAAKNDKLVEQVEWDTSDWKALAKRSPTESGMSDLGALAMYQRNAGDSAGLQSTLDTLRKVEAMADPQTKLAAVQALLLNEQVDDSLNILERINSRAFEFELHWLRGDDARALAAAHRKPNEELEDRRSNVKLLEARVLAQLGQWDRATAIFDSIAAELRTANDAPTIARVAKSLKQLGRVDKAREIAGNYLASLGDQSSFDGPVLTIILAEFFPDHAAEAAVWWKVSSDIHSNDTGADRLKKVMDLLSPAAGNRGIIDAEWLKAIRRPTPNDHIPHQQSIRASAVAMAHAAAGQQDAAREQLKAAAEASKLATAWARLGDFERQQKNWVAAADAYHQAAEKLPPAPLHVYLEAHCRARAGNQNEAAEKLRQVAFRLTVGRFEDRMALASELTEAGLNADARREQEFVLQAIGYREWFVGNVLNQQAHAALGRGDFSKAADLFAKSVAGSLRFGVTYIEPAAYLTLPTNIRLCKARSALAAGRVSDAMDHVNVGLKLIPSDMDIAIKMCPELDRRNHRDQSDAVYHRVVDPFRARLRKHPESAYLQNSVAWLSAVCRRDLEIGLAAARKATSLSPKSPEYFDTLAEICFQRGERSEALAAIRTAIGLNPAREYYRRQLRRIEANDRSSQPDE